MRANERINQLEPALRGAIEGYLTELWTALPGIVEKFDGEEMTVEVKSALTFQYRDQHNELQPISMPNLIHLPVICMTGGGYSLTFPVKQGDEVLVVFACRCIDQWWGFGGVQPQAEFRLHDISDGFAIIGPRSKPRALPSYSTNSVQLRSGRRLLLHRDGRQRAREHQVLGRGLRRRRPPCKRQHRGSGRRYGDAGEHFTGTPHPYQRIIRKPHQPTDSNWHRGRTGYYGDAMRYRRLDANGDMTFGGGGGDFHVNSAEGVEQAVKTGLLLWQGEWFLDLDYGMPWLQEVLGFQAAAIYDAVIQNQILSTVGVTAILEYNSELDANTRRLSVTAKIQSLYAAQPVYIVIPVIYLGYGLGGYGQGPYGGLSFGNPSISA